MIPSADVHRAMQQLLAEQGSCTPVELMRATNLLDYDDFSAWRCGDRRTLDGAWRGTKQEVQALIERMDRFAQSQKLGKEPVSMYGVDGHAGRELIASKDPTLDSGLLTEFKVNRAQLDILWDTGETAATNDLTKALASRDVQAAQLALERLAALNAKEWVVNDATVLVESLRSPPPNSVDSAYCRLALMEQRWQPAAYAVLGGQARDFLAPKWRDLGVALEAAPFDPKEPRRHAALSYLNGLDWANTERCVEATEGHRSQPALLGWLAVAKWRLRDRRAAIECWFEMCWQYPNHFLELVESNQFPDATVRDAWLSAQEADIEPTISPTWFPAWMLLEEPGLAKTLLPSKGDSDPERAFNLLLALAAGGSDRQNMDNRRALQALHPGLLNRYLDALEGP